MPTTTKSQLNVLRKDPGDVVWKLRQPNDITHEHVGFNRDNILLLVLL